MSAAKEGVDLLNKVGHITLPRKPIPAFFSFTSRAQDEMTLRLPDVPPAIYKLTQLLNGQPWMRPMHHAVAVRADKCKVI